MSKANRALFRRTVSTQTEVKRLAVARPAKAFAARRAAIVAAAALASAFASQALRAANTEYDVTNGLATPDLTAAGSYTTGGTPAGTGIGGSSTLVTPSITSDVTFDSGFTYNPTAYTLNSNITFGSLNDLSATALTISDTGTAATLTLGGASDPGSTVPGSSVGDLLYVAGGGSLSIAPGAGVLGLAIGQSGNFNNAGTLNISSAISLGANTLTFTGAGSTTINGIISNTGGVTVATAASLTLSGANTYTGTTTVNSGGTLSITNWGVATAGPFSVGSGTSGTATLNLSASLNLGTNAFSVGAGTASASIGNVNQTAGTLTFTGGNGLLVGNSGGTGTYTLSGTGAVTIPAAAYGVRIGVNPNSTGTFNLNAGTLTLTGATLAVGRFDSATNGTTDTFAQTGGAATVGTLDIGGASGGSTGINATFSLTGGTFTATSFGGLAAGGTNAVAMTIGGSADVTLPAFPTTLGASSTATLNLNSTSSGYLAPSASSANFLGDVTAVTLTTNGARFNVATGLSDTITQALTNAAGNAGILTKTGAGTLILSGTDGYTGGTTVSAGTLEFLNTAAQSSTGTTTVAAGATLGLGVGGSGFFTSANLDSAFANTLGNVSLNASAIVGIDTTAGSFVYASNIPSSSLGLTKLGANTLTLSGTNSYTGPTLVAAGTLNVTGSLSANTAITIAGGTFVDGGTVASVTLTSGALTPGSASVAGTLTTGPLSIAAGTALNYVLGTPTSGSSYISATAVTLPTSGAAVTVNLAGTPTVNGLYPLIGYSALNGGTSTFAVGTVPAGLSAASGHGLAFVNTGSANGTAYLAVTQSSVLYQDTFNRTGSLSGSSPTFQTGTSSTWTAASWTTATTGGGASTLPANTGSSAVIPFSPVTGKVYTFSVEFNPTAASSSSDWLAMGLGNSSSGTGNINSANTLAWMLERFSGTGQAFYGGATGNGTTFGTALNGLETNTITIDTSGANSISSATVDWYLNGALQKTATGVNLSTVANIILGGNGTVTGTAQNLTLSAGGTWNVNAGGSWNTAANWAANALPNAAGAFATLSPVIDGTAATATQNATITLDANQTVGVLSFANSTSGGGFYTVASGTGTNTLILNNSGNGAVLNNYAGSNVISAGVSFADNVQAVVAAGSTLTVSGAISDTAAHSLAVNPTGTTGTLVLANANTIAGPTTITAGTLLLKNQNALQNSTLSGPGVAFDSSVGGAFTVGGLSGNGGIALADNGSNAVTLSVGNNNANTIYSGSLTGTGGLTKIGSGTLTLTGFNTYSGATVIKNGIVQLSPFSSGASNQSFTSDANSGIGTAGYGTTGYTTALAFNQGANLSINGVTFTNTGTALSGANWSVGGTSGWSNNGVSGSFATGFMPASGQTNSLLNHFYYGTGTLNNTQILTITGLTPGQTYDSRVYYRDYGNGFGDRAVNWSFNNGTSTVTLNNVQEDINTTGNFLDFKYVAGSTGTLTLTATDITSGASWHLYGFSNQQISSLPTTTPLTIAAGSSLDLNGDNQQVGSLNDFSLGSGGSVINTASSTTSILTVATSGTATFSGVIGGGAGVTGLAMNGTGTQILAGVNTYTGGTTISAGTLAISAATLGAATSPLTMAGGTLDLNATSQTVGAVSITAASTIQSSGGTGNLTGTSYAASNTSGNAVVAVNLLGTGGLTMSGTGGTLTLSGSDTFSGNTAVTAGTLVLNNQNALQDSTVTTGGTGLVFSSTVGTHAFTFGGLSGSGNLALSDGTNPVALTVGGSNSTSYSGVLSGAGSLTKVGGGTLSLSGINTYSGNTTVSVGTLQLSHASALAYYPLDGTLGAIASGAAILDASGNGHNGTMSAVGASYVAGNFAQGIKFNGSQFASVPYNAAFNVTSYTVNAWVNFANQPASGVAWGIVGTRSTGSDTVDIKYWNNGGTLGLHADIGTGGGWLNTSANVNTTIPVNSWNMVTYTVSSAGYSIYVDGTALLTNGTLGGTPVFMTSGESLYMGNDYGGGGENMVGSEDDVSVYGSVLSAAQINALYAGTTQVTVAGSANLDLNGGSQTVLSLSGGGSVINSNATTSAALALNPAGGTTTFSGVIGGDTSSNPISLSMNGAGTQVLSGPNTYTGGTTLNSGTLVLNNGSSGNTTASAIGTGTLTINGGTLDSTVAGITLGTNNAQIWNGSFTFNGTNSLNMGTGAVTTTAPISVTVNANNLTVGGNITPGGSLTKLGAGTLTLNGNLPLGAFGLAVNGGTVNFGGTLTTNATAGTTFLVGSLTNASAAFVETGGTVTIGIPDGDFINIGNATSASGAFGSLTIAGGTFTAPRINLGGSGTSGGTNGVGLLTDLSGGDVVLKNFFIGGRTVTNTGSATIAGGTLDLTASTVAGIGAYGGGRFEVNIGANLGGSNTGGSVLTGTHNWSMVANTASSQGITNLLGGTLNTNSITAPAGAATGSGIQEFNFNGGTLKFSGSATNATFFSNVLTVAGSGAFVQSGGATIDDNGQTITIAQPLLAPTGGGVTGITASGSGFITAPYVQIVGGNGDATAVAQINSSGVLTGIIVTNPGTGYGTAPTVTLVGGTASGGTTATTAATATVGASTSGGLTKVNTGTLILSASNTYTGATNVNAGTLSLTGAISGASPINVSSNATLTTNANNPFGSSPTGAWTVAGTLASTGAGNGVAMPASVTLNSGTLTGTASGTSGSFTDSQNTVITASGTSTINATSIGIATGNSLTFTTPLLADNLTVSSNLGVPGALGGGGLIKTGAGTLSLLSASTYTGATAINQGTLKLGTGVLGTTSFSGTGSPPTGTLSGTSLITGLTPTAVTNGSPGQQGNGGLNTGGTGVLTDGVNLGGSSNTSYASWYTIGNSAVLTYTLPASTYGYNISNVNVFADWGDTGRSQVGLASISYSTVSAPTTFITISGTAATYPSGTPTSANNEVSYSATGGVMATDVYAIKFNFGTQENGYVGYGELQVLGGANILPSTTAVSIASGSTLDLAGSIQTIGSLSGLTGASIINSSASFPATLILNPTGGSTTFSGVISNGSSATSLALIGAGSQVLTGANTYSGATAVNAGTLVVSGSLANTAVTVAGGATLAVGGTTPAIGTVGGTTGITVAGGTTSITQGTLSTLGTVGNNTTLTINSTAGTTALTMGGAAGSPSLLNMNIGDLISAQGLISIGAGGLQVTLTGNPTGTTQNLITTSAANGLTVAGGSSSLVFAMSGTRFETLGGVTLELANNSSSIFVNEGTSLPVAYWTGTSSTWNTASNWATSASGVTPLGSAPNFTSDVFFTANSAGNLTNTLGANTIINSLTFTGAGTPAASAITIGGGNTLTIMAAASQTGGAGYSAGTGIIVPAGNGAVTINAPVVLGGSQTWTNASSNLLSLGAAVNNNGFTLTTAGPGNFTFGAAVSGTGGMAAGGGGTVTLTGSNTFTGALTVSTGATAVLTGNNSARPVNAGSLTVVNSGATLQLQANAGNTSGGFSSAMSPEYPSSSGVQPFFLASGGTLQLRSDSSVTFNGGNNMGGMGSATVNIDVNDINAGNTNNTITFAPLGFNTTSTTFNITGGNGYTLALGSINNGGASAVAFNTTTANASIGAINNVTGLIKSGAGTLTLTAADNLTGATAINGGTLVVDSAAGLGSTATTININAAATLTLASNTAFGSGANPIDNVTMGNTGSYAATFSLGRATAGSVTPITHNFGVLTLSLNGGNPGQINVTAGPNAVTGGVDTMSFSSLIFGNFNAVTETLNPTGGNLVIAGNASLPAGNTSSFTDILDLDGTTAGNAINGAISNGAALGLVAINKTNTSTWTLNGASTYTGATNITGGKLTLGATASTSTGASLGNTAVSVTNATLAVIPGPLAAASGNSIAGTLTLNANSVFTMVDGATSTFNVTGAGASTLAPASGTSPVLNFEIGGSTTAVDQLNISGAVSVGAAQDVLNIVGIGTTGLTPTTYTIITGGAGSALNTNFVLASDRAVINTGSSILYYPLTLGGSATTETITVGTAVPGVAYWTGGQGAVWNTPTSSPTNWSSDPAGATDLNAVPGSYTDVYFTATGSPGNLTNTLGASTTINSLNFTATNPSVTIAPDGSTLTINNAGVTNLSSNAQAVNVPVILGASQTWTNSGGTLTFGGGVTAGGNLLTFAGSGATTISGTTAFTTSAGVTVNSGAGPITISSPVTLGAAQTWTNNSTSLLTLGSSANAITSGGNTLTTAGTGNITLAGALTGTGGGLTVSGTGTVTLSATGNSYTGSTLIRGGTLAVPSGSITATNILDIGGPNGAVLAVSGGSVTTAAGDNIRIGMSQAGNTTSIGTIYLTSGTITAVSDSNFGFNNVGGGVATGYGYQTGGIYNQSGGAFYVGVLIASGTATGTYSISGGTLNTGQAEIGGGGSLSGATSTFNVSGSASVNFGAVNTGNASGSTTININGGTLASSAWSTDNKTHFNFNGGTLQTNAASTTFLGADTNAINLYAGGGTINTNGNNVTITAGLANPANNSLASATVTDSTDVFSAPTTVTFTGATGTNATGYTVLNASGHVTGVVITNGGSFTGTETGVTIAGATPSNVGFSSPVTAANNLGGLTKNGAGVLTLSGASTYLGGTTINAGTLAIASTGSLAAGGAMVDNYGATLQLGDAANPLSQTVSSFTGTGTVVGGNATSNSVLNVGNSGPDTITGNLGVYGGTATQNNLGLTKSGGGTLALAGLSTYTGPTVVSAGTLQLGTQAALTGQSLLLHLDNNLTDSANGATVTPVGGSPAYVVGIKGQAISLNGTSQYLTIPYSSTLNLTGAYTTSAWVKLNAAVPASSPAGSGPALFSTRNGGDTTFDLQLTNTGLHADIGNGSGTWLNTAANYTTNALNNLGWNMVTYSVSSTGYSIYLNGTLATSGTDTAGTPVFMKSGQTLSIGSQEAGGGTYGNPAGAGYLNGAVDEVNIFPTALTASQIATLYNSTAGLNQVLPSTTPVTVAGAATFDLAGVSQTIASLSDFTLGSGGSVISSAISTPVTLTLNPISGSTTFSGIIGGDTLSNPISLVKNGTGTQVLAGANSYLGGTTVNAGTLTVASTGTLGATTGTLAVNNPNTGAATAVTLNIMGATITGSLTGAIATASSGTNTATINLSTGASSLTVNQTTPANFPGMIIGSGSFVLGSLTTSTLTLSGSNSYSGGTVVNGGTLTGTGASPFGTGPLTVNNPNTGAGTAVVLNVSTTAATNVGSLSGTISPPAGGVNTTTINNGGQPLTVTQTASGTYGGVIAGTGAFTLGSASTATLTLSGSNTYSGGTVINGGTLTATNPSALGAATNSLAVNNPNTGSGTNVVLNVSAALTVGSLSGTVATSFGSPNTDTINIQTGQTFTVNQTTAGEYDGVIAGAGNFVLGNSGANTLILGGANTYTGTTTINGGTLQVGNAGTTGSLSPSSAITVGTLGTLAFNRTNTMVQGTDFAAGISGGGSVTQAGSGVVVLTGSNPYSGPTNINAGTLQLGDGVTAGSIPNSSSITINAGTLAFNIPVNLTLTQGTDFTSSSIGGGGGLTQAGGGTLVLSAPNSYTGPTNINAGIVNLGGPETTADFVSGGPLGSGTIAFGGGTLQYSPSNQNDYSSRFSTASNQPIRIDTNGQIVTFASPLTSIGGTLTVLDTNATHGALILTAASTYTGGTTIASGTLLVNGPAVPGVSSPTGLGSVTVTGGRLGGTGTIGNGTGTGAIVSINGGTLSPGPEATNTAMGTLYTGDQTWFSSLNGSSTYNFKIAGETTGSYLTAAGIEGEATPDQDFVDVNGILDIDTNTNGGTFTLAITGNASPLTSTSEFIIARAQTIEVNGVPVSPGTFISNDFTVTEPVGSTMDTVSVQTDTGTGGGYDVVVTPEPGSLGLLGVASLGLLRRRRKAQALAKK